MTQHRRPLRPSHHLALEARMLFDAAAAATAVTVAVDATETRPGVTATGAAASVTVDEHSTGAAQDLFSGVSVSSDRAGQELSTLVVTVNRSGANQALVIDGSTIKLESTTAAFATHDKGYTYGVSVNGNTTTITISIDSSLAYQPVDVKNLIDGMAYKVLDNSVTSGTVSVTLKSLSDTGDTAELGITATVAVDSRTNVAPVLSDAGIPDLAQSITLADLGSSSEVAYSRDGKFLYASNASGTLVTFTVGEHGALTATHVLRGVINLGSIVDLALSADGNSLYAISGSNVVALDVGADGSLSNARSSPAGGTVRNVALSDDGAQLYVSNQYGGMRVFNRDANTGDLTQIQSLDEGSVGGGRTRSIVSVGDYVFVASGTNLVTFERNDNGTLSKLAFGSLSTGIGTGITPSLAASADGSLVFLGDGSIIRIYALRNQGQGPELNAMGSSALAGVSALAVSSNGRTLYATSSSGTLSIYAIAANGALTLAATLRDVGSAAAVALSADGNDVLVAGSSLSRFSALTTYITGTDIAIARDLGLSDSNLDALANGTGDYSGARLSIERAGGASADDVFGFDAGNGFSLVGNQVLKNGAVVASFSQTGGMLTLGFAAGTSTADANAVARQLSYRNAGSPANGSIVTLSVTAHDGALAGQVASIALLMTTNSAPSLGATPVVQPSYVTSATVVTLFANAAVNTGEAGQSIVSLTLRIEGLDNAANEFLIVDGTRIDLTRAGNGSTSNGHTWSYSLSNGVGTLSLSQSAGIGLAATQSLVNGIAYVNDSTQATVGSRSVTITQLRDNGGTGNGGQDSAAPGITATIALAINNAPQLDITITDPDPRLLYADGTLSGYTEFVTDIVVSADGKTVFISGSSTANAAGTSTLRVYSRDTATGELTLLQTFAQGTSDNPATATIEADGLNGISTLAIHGNTLYVAGYGAAGSASAYSLVQFNLDTSTGRLSYAGVVATQGLNGATGLDAQISEIVISADGRSLYTINGVNTIDGANNSATPNTRSTLAQFARDPITGALTHLGAYVGGTAALGMNAPSGLVISPDGKSVYVANRSNSMITVLARDTTTGVLSYTGFINASTIAADTDSGAQPTDNRYLLELQDIVISPDGTYVYVGSGQQATLTVFRRDTSDGSLTFVRTVDLYNSGLTPANALAVRELVISADGSALYVGVNNGQLILFGRDANTGALSHTGTVNTGLRTTQIAVSPDGMSLYSGRSQTTAGVAILSALPHVGYRATGDSTPFAGGITFSDVDFDASASYAGTTITVVRAAGASAEDVFGLRAGNGLTLSNGQILRNGLAIAEFSATAGTLSIRFTASVDKATANQVLRQISYRNSNAEAPARVDLKLSVSDGGKSAETLLVLLREPVPAEPTLTATGKDPQLTLGTGGLPAAVDLFDGVDIQLGATGGALAEFTLTVNRSGAGQALVIAGQQVALVDSNGMVALPGGYLVQVEENAQGSTIKLWLDRGANSPADIAGLIDGLAYQVLDGNVADGTLTIRLASLVDANGLESEPGTEATVTLVDQRRAPSLGAETGALWLDGKLVLTGDGGSPNRFEGLKGVVSVGDQVYVLRATLLWNYDEATKQVSEIPAGTVYVFQRAADGTLTLRDTIESTAQSPLTKGQELGVSADGRTLFVVSSNGVTLFTRNTDTGTLTSAGSFDAASSTANNGLVLRGDNLYISTATGLQLYQRDNGAWVQRDLEVAPGDGSARFTALQFSADGQLLFAATLGGNTLASVFRVSSDGTLTHLANATDVGGEHYANALALSTDGKTLYVAEGGWLHTFTVDTNGSLTKRGTALTLDSTTIRQIMVSPDDAAVIVVGEIGGDGGSKGRIELFTRGNDGALALRERLDAFGNMDDWDNYLSLQEIRSATLSADGTQLYIAGAFNDEQVLVIDLQPQRSVFIEGEGAVALMPGGTLADAQLDALGNYQGASITVQREGGARAGDVLGFIDGAGLSLQNGQILLNGAAVASFVVDSAGQLTLRFTANVTRADAQQILRRIAYSSSNQDLTGGGATANYQVVFHDGDGYSATQRVALAIEGRNDAPVVTSTALTPTFKAGGEAVKLFENTQIDTVEAGQKVWKIIVTLNAVDPDDVLGVGAEQISLRNLGSGIQTTPGGMEYVVVVDNGTTSIHLMVDGTGQRAATLVDSLSYRHAGEASTGSRQISLQVSESVEWNPSVPSNSTSTLGSQAQVILTHEAKPPINQAPVAGTDAYLPSSITAGAAYSTTLPDSLFVDAEGDPLQWRVDGLPAGLTFDSGTRSITGTLDTNSAAAQYSITVTVRDSQGREASRSFALQVLAAQVPDPGPGTDPATPPGTGSGSAPGAGSNPGLVGEPTPTLLPSGAGFPNERDSQRERNTDEAPANGAVALPLGLPTPWRAATPAVAPNIALPATATLPDRLVLPPQEAPMDSMALRFADGSSSPVVTLADGEGPALSARQPLLAGAWSRDLGGNRLVFDLPEGFISTRTAIDSLTLRNADGRALPAGVRLDIKNGRVVLVGSPATALNLQLVVTAVDGQTLTLRLQIEAPPATERTPAPQNEESSEAPLAKTTLSEQLRHRATSDLLRQAQELLDDLAHEAT